ncbi:hypothetical protein [Metamycoplasma hominis]|uniref:hypothetical protein n=1 Tax=Metamycoplasma hominis TaxID=2098 RepID=UPI0012AB14BC|nr:hypothetical protein [Metamycoplasma hominis]
MTLKAIRRLNQFTRRTKVDTSKTNQSLQNNNVDASSTIDQIINATTEIKKPHKICKN